MIIGKVLPGIFLGCTAGTWLGVFHSWVINFGVISNLQDIPVYLVVEPTFFDPIGHLAESDGNLLVLPGTQPPKGAPVVLVACGARLRNRPRSTTSGRHPCHPQATSVFGES